MKRPVWVLVTWFAMVFGAETVPQTPAPADLVLRNGLVFSETPQEALAIRNGIIAFIGSNQAIGTWIGPDTTVIDLQGGLLLPGFVDNHNHVGEGGEVDCFPERDRPLALQSELLAECRAETAPGQWIIGYGAALEHELEAMSHGPNPRALLDRLFPDHPVIIMDYTSHAMFVNSAALAKAEVPNAQPIGGVIMHDETGTPNGILVDNAGDLVMETAVNQLPDRDQRALDGIRHGLKEAARHGITTIGDGRTYWRRGMMEAWRKVERTGELTARVSLRPWIYPNVAVAAQRRFLRQNYQNDRTRLLIVNQVKMYSDGIPEYTTARMIKPYPTPIFAAHSHGLNYLNRATMMSWLAELDQLGYGAHIHAIGDLGVRDSLDAVAAQRAAGSQARYNLTHLVVVDRADITRFAELDVDADLQITQTSMTAKARAAGLDQIIGAERAAQVLFTPVKQLKAAGANVVLSSDWTVNPINPLAAISHTVAEGSLTLAEALDASTINAARALGLADITGSITLGKSADLVLFQRDLRGLPPQALRREKVQLTLLRGRVVYRAGQK